jgi:hypothetical protein
MERPEKSECYERWMVVLIVVVMNVQTSVSVTALLVLVLRQGKTLNP